MFASVKWNARWSMSHERRWIPAFAGTTIVLRKPSPIRQSREAHRCHSRKSNIFVIPAKAGIQRLLYERHWVPAFARTTIVLRKPLSIRQPRKIHLRHSRESNIFVIPAKAGIQRRWHERHWIPAFAGMTIVLWVQTPQSAQRNTHRRPPPSASASAWSKDYPKSPAKESSPHVQRTRLRMSTTSHAAPTSTVTTWKHSPRPERW